MRPQRVTARVPGKLMLAGEYAVLQGGACIACTVDRFLEVEVMGRTEGSGFLVASDLWPEVLNGDHLPALLVEEEPLLQLIATVRQHQPQLTDLALRVQSQLTVSHGLGSSSAVRLAALLALQNFKAETSPDLLWECAREVWRLQQSQQGFASGYDVVTQSTGGLIRWQPRPGEWPGTIAKLPSERLNSWVHVMVGGRGAPTTRIGSSTRLWLKAQNLTASLDALSAALVTAMWNYCDDRQNWPDLCAVVRAHRNLFVDAPTFPRAILEALRGQPGFDETWTFKTTGAGGEDAILLLGPRQDLQAAIQCMQALGWQELNALFTDAGASWEREFS